MHEAPFKVGQRIRPEDLATWQYAGLSGIPGRDKHAVRRFTKGDWSMEVRALINRSKLTSVVSIRTSEQDAMYWQETRERLMRNRR